MEVHRVARAMTNDWRTTRREVAAMRIGRSVVGGDLASPVLGHMTAEAQPAIGKRLEDAAPTPSRQIELSFRTIFEREPEAVLIDHFDPMLRQRLDALQGQAIAGALPVFLELGAVKRRPLESHSQRTVRRQCVLRASPASRLARRASAGRAVRADRVR